MSTKRLRRLHGVESDPKLSEKNFKNKGCPSLALMLAPDRLRAPRGHARPGRALLPCPIYPLSAASVRVQPHRTFESVLRQPQLSSYHRAWEFQQPPVNHFLGSCSFFYFPLPIFSHSALSRNPGFIW